MKVDFRISALEAKNLQPLFALSDAELNGLGYRRCLADAMPGYPCRVSLQDAQVGEQLILLSFLHHDVKTPYQASGPIYVRANAVQAQPEINVVPDAVRRRLLSVRAYDKDGMLVAADVIEGHDIESLIDQLFADTNVAYLHLHHARQGCYSCRVDRA